MFAAEHDGAAQRRISPEDTIEIKTEALKEWKWLSGDSSVARKQMNANAAL